MKRNVCKEITPMDPNDKRIASLQPNLFPGRYNLKLQENNTNFAIRFNLRHFWPSIPSFAFALLLKCSFTVLRGYFFQFILANLMVISDAYI